MERFDILDIHGQPTGMTADKGAPLQDGQYYLGVHVYIHDADNAFLLQRRAMDKAFRPGGWDIHMGHAVSGESSRRAAVREIAEEVGLGVDEADLRFIGRMVWEQYHHMIDVYFVQADYAADALALQPEEVIEVKRVDAREMLALVHGMDYRPAAYRDITRREIERLMDPDALTIRPVGADDVPLLLELIRELAEYERMTDQVTADAATLRRSLLDLRAARAALAYRHGRAVGYMVYFFSFSTFTGRSGLYLEDIYLRPELRGQGLGKAMFRHLAGIVVEYGCARMEWSCLNWNAPSIGFYRSLGAQPMEDWTVFRLDEERIRKLAL